MRPFRGPPGILPQDPPFPLRGLSGVAVAAERHRAGRCGAQRACTGVADVSILHLWADLQPAAAEPEKIQTAFYDSDRGVVYVWKYLTVHNGDVCDDKDLAGEGNDGRNGHSRAVSVSAVPGAGGCEPGDVAAFYLCVYDSGFCHQHILHGYTDNNGRRGGTSWNQEKEREVCG